MPPIPGLIEEILLTDQATPPQQPPVQEDPLNNVPIKLELPVIAVNMILTMLSQLPYAQSANVITAIRQQGDPQVAAAREVLAAAAAPPMPANRKSRRAAAAKTR